MPHKIIVTMAETGELNVASELPPFVVIGILAQATSLLTADITKARLDAEKRIVMPPNGFQP